MTLNEDFAETQQAWTDLIHRNLPPHRTDDWFTPLFWPLLTAAHAEPAVRRWYPGVSMNFLGFFHHDNGFADADYVNSRPGIATWASGTYTVLTGWYAPAQAELFATQDPVKAAHHLARLLTTR